ncbi:putative conjugative transposon protein [Streptococcus pneumoniae]|nr:putative conjugative transposon protein [Streptococcus pneumoniae]VOP90494.1 putative conjugative transposon protein [Streptococcus pneumoniae]VRN76816.1 putative conjugative transposon protein [Streptococcus pneumoniae]
MELTNNIWAIDDSLILLKDGSVLAVFEVEPQVINTIEDGEKEDSKDLVLIICLVLLNTMILRFILLTLI